MKSVQFLQHHDIYNGGEIAGFDDAHAKHLVAAGIARYATAASAPATLEQLITEVKSRGYKGKAVEQIARDRFDGKFGDGARYLASDASDDDGPDDAAADDQSSQGADDGAVPAADDAAAGAGDGTTQDDGDPAASQPSGDGAAE